MGAFRVVVDCWDMFFVRRGGYNKCNHYQDLHVFDMHPFVQLWTYYSIGYSICNGHNIANMHAMLAMTHGDLVTYTHMYIDRYVVRCRDII